MIYLIYLCLFRKAVAHWKEAVWACGATASYGEPATQPGFKQPADVWFFDDGFVWPQENGLHRCRSFAGNCLGNLAIGEACHEHCIGRASLGMACLSDADGTSRGRKRRVRLSSCGARTHGIKTGAHEVHTPIARRRDQITSRYVWSGVRVPYVRPPRQAAEGRGICRMRILWIPVRLARVLIG